MKLNRILRIHPSAVPLLQNSAVSGDLIEFLAGLERDPGIEGRSLLFDSGYRRIEATQLGDVCVGYDLRFVLPPIYPALAPQLCNEIHVWEIAHYGSFAHHWSRPSESFIWARIRGSR